MNIHAECFRVLKQNRPWWLGVYFLAFRKEEKQLKLRGVSNIMRVLVVNVLLQIAT